MFLLLSLSLSFFLWDVESEISFSTYFNHNLKNRCHSKIILGHAVFQLLFESNFSLQLSFLFK